MRQSSFGACSRRESLLKETTIDVAIKVIASKVVVDTATKDASLHIARANAKERRVGPPGVLSTATGLGSDG